MAYQNTLLPLYDKIWLKYTFSRVMDSLTLLLLLMLLGYRAFSHNNYSFPWFIAFMCELWFTFNWVLTVSSKWNPAYTITHLDRLLLRVPEPELPKLDLFVTTADPVLEPPIITINTVLSLLALEYPANKLACYVSDDGCSPLTFYALLEASKFAQLWVPFCKKYDIQVRAPFRYFSDDDAAVNGSENLTEFNQDWLLMKFLINMAYQNTLLPLYDKIWLKYTFSRVMDSLTLLLLLMLLGYRVFSHNNYSFPWFIAFMCELWFTFNWVLTISTKWNPAYTITHLDRLLLWVPEPELPKLDLFVTTADPVLEPPIITINTVLSLLALEYPANKLACYVSDDGCSPLTFYALLEASKFAQLWVPFCKKYDIQVRAPFRYFSDDDAAVNGSENLTEFNQDWLLMKNEYGHLSRKIQNAAQKSIPLVGEFADFSSTQPKNHSTIIKVIYENKECLSDGIPHLIYISREKRPQHLHQFKAGAMNVLTRVSGLMTNAPFIMNLDCDMYVNNPKIALHALCILLDSKGEKEVAFAQCPQQFYDGLKDDALGNQLVALFMYMGGGLAGLQGICYAGTNCLHRRKVIYGHYPDHDIIQNGNKDLCVNTGKLSKKEIFGSSKEFLESAAHALEGKTFTPYDNLWDSLEVATEIASCEYEYGTAWGKQVGWIYGSTSEDVLTSIKIHSRGWRSEFCSPNPVAFMGCSPQDNLSQMAQQKRWASGLLDILLSEHCPIFGTLFGKLQFRQCLGYIWLCSWALRSVPEIFYASLPAYCIITNTSFLPKELGLWIPATLLVIHITSTITEYLKTGLSIRTWWNNQRMTRITTMNPWFSGFLTILLKRLRVSDPVFTITKKEQAPSSKGVNDSENAGRFIFNDSPIFLPGTTILLIQLTALVIYWLGWQPLVRSGQGNGVGEVFCCAYIVVCYWPFLKGLFEKGEYGIPFSTKCKSIVLAFIFVHLSKSMIVG